MTRKISFIRSRTYSDRKFFRVLDLHDVVLGMSEVVNALRLFGSKHLRRAHLFRKRISVPSGKYPGSTSGLGPQLAEAAYVHASL